MITPDNLAARFAPPLTGGDLYARQAAFTDSAYELAERALDALPRGHHLDQAVIALESAAHWVCAGLAAVHADGVAEAEVQEHGDQVAYALGGPARPPAPAGGAGPALNISLWRTGVLNGLQLHPLARLVALTLAEAAGEDGRIAAADQPTVEALGMGTGLDINNLLAAIEELADGGWISRHTDGGPTAYQLRLPSPTAR